MRFSLSPTSAIQPGTATTDLIRFLLGSRLRCSEAVAVKVAHIDLRNRRVKVRNGKRRQGEKKA